jgi:hypothetical protein
LGLFEGGFDHGGHGVHGGRQKIFWKLAIRLIQADNPNGLSGPVGTVIDRDSRRLNGMVAVNDRSYRNRA